MQDNKINLHPGDTLNFEMTHSEIGILGTVHVMVDSPVALSAKFVSGADGVKLIQPISQESFDELTARVVHLENCLHLALGIEDDG